MNDPATHRPFPDRLGAALCYGPAALPLLFVCVLLVRGAAGGDVSAPWLLGILTDMGAGIAGLALLRWRHRRPWQIALATALPVFVSMSAVGPALAGLTSLATHRRWKQLTPIAGLLWVSIAASTSWTDDYRIRAFFGVLGITAIGGVTALGLYFGERRDLDAVRRAAAAAARVRWVEQAKLEERLRIAQEMHDVLAHRISLLAMLAGGLAYREDLTPGQTRETALAIQENAHQSLNELRAVLGTLRHEGGDGLEAPQPTLAHLDVLFEEVRAAGQRVQVEDTVDGKERLPAQTGRHAYRIVQESLTNARKHAPGSHVRAELGGRPGAGLHIRVSNPAPAHTPAGPGGRLGLVGLAERTRMAGGTLSHTVRNGRFVLDALLPWEADHR